MLAQRIALATVATAVWLLVALALLVGTSRPAGAQSADLGSLINAYRQQHGLAPFTVSATLTCAAQQWATRDAAAGTVDHDNVLATQQRLTNCGDSGTFVGEVIAGNAGAGAQATLLQFEGSAEHNAILLGGGNAMGVGHATGTFQGFSPFDFWVVDIATENGPQATPVPTQTPVGTRPPVPTPPPPVSSGTGSFGRVSSSGGAAASTPGFFGGGITSSSGGAVAGTFPGFSTSGGAAASTPGFFPAISSGPPIATGVSTSGGAPASTFGGGFSTSGGAAASTFTSPQTSSSGGAAASTGP